MPARAEGSRRFPGISWSRTRPGRCARVCPSCIGSASALRSRQLVCECGVGLGWGAVLKAGLPNKRLKLAALIVLRKRVLCPWRGTDFVPHPCAGGESPALKRDPLGSAFTELSSDEASPPHVERVLSRKPPCSAGGRGYPCRYHKRTRQVSCRPYHVAVTDDADYERALVVLHSVEVTGAAFLAQQSTHPPLARRRDRAIAILVCLNL